MGLGHPHSRETSTLNTNRIGNAKHKYFSMVGGLNRSKKYSMLVDRDNHLAGIEMKQVDSQQEQYKHRFPRVASS